MVEDLNRDLPHAWDDWVLASGLITTMVIGYFLTTWWNITRRK